MKQPAPQKRYLCPICGRVTGASGLTPHLKYAHKLSSSAAIAASEKAKSGTAAVTSLQQKPPVPTALAAALRRNVKVNRVKAPKSLVDYEPIIVRATTPPPTMDALIRSKEAELAKLEGEIDVLRGKEALANRLRKEIEILQEADKRIAETE